MFEWMFGKINELIEPTFEQCMQGAARGEPEAQYYLAQHYLDGRRVPQDWKRVRELLSASARGAYLPRTCCWLAVTSVARSVLLRTPCSLILGTVWRRCLRTAFGSQLQSKVVTNSNR